MAGARDASGKRADAADGSGRQSGRSKQERIYFSVTVISSWLINIDMTDNTKRKDRKTSLLPKKKTGDERKLSKRL